ncbi:hypothetical protein WKH21_06270 [Pantoea agglomerans]|jgi:hypothetical protein|uniref:hypothetical protein n=1 Tax=Enterobacter agglomerans TaxID=549 RepID=UPI0013CD7271|nr:hypothetical protein [Pantoea agglomerans]NEG82750.1 hypothetical protein [Pantoea agglomerans]
MHKIIIFKDEPGSFVTVQHYDAAPPFPKNIKLEGKIYDLTIFEDAEDKYLVAHNEPLNPQFVREVIDRFSVTPLPKE